MLSTACPKPPARRRVKAKAKRVESKHAQYIRALCVERDGDCRLNDPTLWLIFGSCSGESEFAHLGAHKRFKTRGMLPEERHLTPGAIMLCTRHHAAYDAHAFNIQAASSRGADGPLAFQSGKHVHVETDK